MTVNSSLTQTFTPRSRSTNAHLHVSTVISAETSTELRMCFDRIATTGMTLVSGKLVVASCAGGNGNMAKTFPVLPTKVVQDVATARSPPATHPSTGPTAVSFYKGFTKIAALVRG